MNQADIALDPMAGTLQGVVIDLPWPHTGDCKIMKLELTAEELRQALSYCPSSGVFTWLHRDGSPDRWNTRYAGRVAGSRQSNGYIKIWLNNQRYFSHRLVWLYVHGNWPEQNIDHINGNPSDNRMCNLRDVSAAVNGQNQRKAHANNRSTKVLGVSFHEGKKKYQARITVSGRIKHLGWFDSVPAAREAYLMAKRRLHEGCSI